MKIRIVVFMLLLLCIDGRILYGENLVWETFGELQWARSHYEALAVDQNRILVMGGTGDYGMESSTEIIDFASGKITMGPSMHYSRSNFRALYTPDSNIIVIGGYMSTAYDQCKYVEMLDRKTMTWKVIGNLVTPRAGFSAVFISPTKIMIAGGSAPGYQTTSSTEIFDIQTGKSVLTSSLPFDIGGNLVMISSKGSTLNFGGRTGGAGSNHPTDILKYDIANDKWTKIGDMPEPASGPCYLNLSNGSIFYAGGSQKEADPMTTTSAVVLEENDRYRKVCDMTYSTNWQGMAFLNDSIVVVQGGFHDNMIYEAASSLINIKNFTSAVGPSTSTTRAFHKCVTLRNKSGDYVFSISGKTGQNILTKQVDYLHYYSKRTDTIFYANCDTVIRNIASDKDSITRIDIIKAVNAHISYSPSVPSKKIRLIIKPIDNTLNCSYSYQITYSNGDKNIVSDSMSATNILGFSPDSLGIDFGNVDLSKDSVISIPVYNKSDHPVTVQLQNIPEKPFKILPSIFPMHIEPRSYGFIRVLYNSSDIGRFTASFILQNLCINTEIKLSGRSFDKSSPTEDSSAGTCKTKTIYLSDVNGIQKVNVLADDNIKIISITPGTISKNVKITIELDDKEKDGFLKIALVSISDSITVLEYKIDKGAALPTIDSDNGTIVMDPSPAGINNIKIISIYNKNDFPLELTEAYFINNTRFSLPQGILPLKIAPQSRIEIPVCCASGYASVSDSLYLQSGCLSVLIPAFAPGSIFNYSATDKCDNNLLIKKYTGKKNAVLYSAAYPNPGSEKIYVDLQGLTNNESPLIINAAMRNSFGIETDTKFAEIEGASSSSLVFDVSSYSVGTYFIVLRIDDDVVTIPCIIER